MTKVNTTVYANSSIILDKPHIATIDIKQSIYCDSDAFLYNHHNPIIDKAHFAEIDVTQSVYYSDDKSPQKSSQLSNFSYEKMIAMYIEYIEIQRSSREEWGRKYLKIMEELSSLINDHKLIEGSSKVFEKYYLSNIAEMIKRDYDAITNQNDFFYTLSNFLSKYPEINNDRNDSYLSIVDNNKISLVLLRKNECIFKKKGYIAKLNLVFTPENRVNFSSSDSNEDNYFIYGSFDSPKSFFSNRKIKKILRILDEWLWYYL